MSNKVPVQNPLSLDGGSTSELAEGGFYVVKRGELVRLERSEDDLPTVPVSRAAKDALLEVRRQCRMALGGYRPDVALVASALVLHACEHCDAQAIVVEHFHCVAPAKPGARR
jgi:hypothetical protein